MIGTNYICSCKSNYHMIMTTTTGRIVESGVKHRNSNPKPSVCQVIKRSDRWKYPNDIKHESIYASNLIYPQCLIMNLIGCRPVYGRNSLSWNIIVSWSLRKLKVLYVNMKIQRPIYFKGKCISGVVSTTTTTNKYRFHIQYSSKRYRLCYTTSLLPFKCFNQQCISLSECTTNILWFLTQHYWTEV